MNRRIFMKSSGIAAATALLAGTSGMAMCRPDEKTSPLLEKNNFKLKYAPHLGMFENTAGSDPLDQIQFMADAGFRAMEDNGMKDREVALQEKPSRPWSLSF